MRQRLVVESLVVDRAHFVDALATQFPEIDRGSGRALDLGCGTQGMPGDTQDQLAARGYSCVGVDSLLEGAGFELLLTWPGWHVFEAIAWFNLAERAGRGRVLYRPAAWLARTAARVMHRLRNRRSGPGAQDETERALDRLRFSAAVGFAVRRI